MDAHMQQQSTSSESHTAALAERQAELDQLQQHSQQQQNSLNIVHAQLQAMYDQQDALKHSLAQQEYDNSQLQEMLQHASQNHLEELQHRLQQSEERVNAFEQQLGGVCQERDRALGQLQSVGGQLQRAEGQLQGLRQQQAEQAPQVAALVSERQEWIVQLQQEREAASQASLKAEVWHHLDRH